MKRSVYFQALVILVSTVVLSAVLIVGWIILFIPTMIKPSMLGKVDVSQKFTEQISKRMVRSAMRNARKQTVQ